MCRLKVIVVFKRHRAYKTTFTDVHECHAREERFYIIYFQVLISPLC